MARTASDPCVPSHLVLLSQALMLVTMGHQQQRIGLLRQAGA
jgi:hypothetical protein